MKGITEIIVVTSKEFKVIKKSILSSIIVPKNYKYEKGQRIEVKKNWFGWFLYGSIKVEITKITKDVFVKGYRTNEMLIIFKKVKRK